MQELKDDAFSQYGSFLNSRNCGEPLRGQRSDSIQFYPDRMLQAFATTNIIAYCPLVIKPRPLQILDIEKHIYTEEVLGGFDQDVCFHVATTLGDTVRSEHIRVFRLPAGWWVRLKRGVWHKAPYALGDTPTHGMVILPPGTYANDCVEVRLTRPINIHV